MWDAYLGEISVAMNTSLASEGKGLMGLSRPKTGYDGIVNLPTPQGPQKIQVSNGVTVIQGKKFFVTGKGEVTDDSDKLIGMIKEGNFVPEQMPQQMGAAQPQQGVQQ